MTGTFKKWFLDFCSYYHGEFVDPYQLELSKNVGELSESKLSELVSKSSLWRKERLWCYKVENWQLDSSVCDEYVKDGLKDFMVDDGVPMTIKATIYNGIVEKIKDKPKAFKEYYVNRYLGQRPPKKRLTVGKRILNQYRLEMCYFYSEKDKERTESAEQHYKFEIVNAVDVYFGLDYPVSETLMCKFLAHAHAHDYKVDVIPNPGQSISNFVKSYHLEYREIRHLLLSHLNLEVDNYNSVEYIGRWNNNYVYAEVPDIKERKLEFPVYYLIKDGKVARVQDYRCIEIMKDVRKG